MTPSAPTTETRQTYILADYRHNCGRLLFRGLLVSGSAIQIRCPKCGRAVTIGTAAIETTDTLPAQSMLDSQPKRT